MEHINCIICNKTRIDRIVIEENGYKCRKCPTCDLIYVSPRPSIQEIHNIYNHDEGNTSIQKNKNLGAICIAKHHLDIINKYVPKGSLLEIGPSMGYFLYSAKKKGYKVYGIELNKVLANYLRNKKKIQCIDTPLDISSFGGIKFDVIYHRNVVSHLYNPITEFETMNYKLRKDGFIIFETGNLGDVAEKLFTFFSTFYLPDHLFSFSEKSIRKLLKITGFELVRIYRYSELIDIVLTNILRKAIKFLRISRQNNQRNSVNYPDFILKSRKVHSSVKRIILEFYFLMKYLVLYQIGFIMPKNKYPQTIIIVAKKISVFTHHLLERSPKDRFHRVINGEISEQ